jgi:leucyl aminopeptidase (aminopeptidase T)
LNKIEKLAKLVLLDCLELQPKQPVLLVSEVKQTYAALAFHSVAAKAHLELISLALAERPNGEPRLSAFSRNSLQAADLAIILLPKLDHESLNWLRQQNRTKVIVFSQIDDEAVLPSLETDHRQLRERTRKLADILTIGRALQLTTNNPAVAGLKMSIAQNRGNAELVPFLPETYFTSLPPGRAFITPAINSVEGEIVLDDLAGSHTNAPSPIELKIVAGRIAVIKGGKAANELRRRLRHAGANARQVVEIGFGLNDKARLGNSEFEDEKTLGTVHLGFGRLTSGNKIPEIFARGILQAPSVMIDGKKIVEKGKILIG